MTFRLSDGQTTMTLISRGTLKEHHILKKTSTSSAHFANKLIDNEIF